MKNEKMIKEKDIVKYNFKYIKNNKSGKIWEVVYKDNIQKEVIIINYDFTRNKTMRIKFSQLLKNWTIKNFKK